MDNYLDLIPTELYPLILRHLNVKDIDSFIDVVQLVLGSAGLSKEKLYESVIYKVYPIVRYWRSKYLGKFSLKLSSLEVYNLKAAGFATLLEYRYILAALRNLLDNNSCEYIFTRGFNAGKTCRRFTIFDRYCRVCIFKHNAKYELELQEYHMGILRRVIEYLFS